MTAKEFVFCEKVPATLSGFVYHDENGNGRRDVGEAAIAGVRVELLDSGGNVVATTRANGKGFYQFAMLPAGRYSLRRREPPGGWTVATRPEAAAARPAVGPTVRVT